MNELDIIYENWRFDSFILSNGLKEMKETLVKINLDLKHIINFSKKNKIIC